MHDAIMYVLHALKQQLGEDIFSNPSRCVAALRDLVGSGGEKRVRNLLRIAICELHAYVRLKKVADSSDDNFTAHALINEMSDDYMIPVEISRMVIGCIAVFTGHDPLPNVAQAAPHELQPARTSQISKVSAPASQSSRSKLVRFGNYDWCVLDVQNGRVLLLCDKIIDNLQYHEELDDTNWADCSLRRHLNNSFYNTFGEAERLRISDSKINTPRNPWYGTEGGKDVIDKIFLLSIDEVVKYFGDSGLLQNRKDYLNIINDKYNSARKAVNFDDASAWWWLRSPGDMPDFAAYVCVDGTLHISGSLVAIAGGIGGGVRPALWLKINS